MTPSRQVQRRERFQAQFESMPLWETWTEEQQVDTGFRDDGGEWIIKTVERDDFRRISRRKRRAMARIASKRN